MRKKFSAIIIAAILIANLFVLPVAAETGILNGDEIIISPMYTYISTGKATLSINSSGKATVETDVTGNSSVTSIKATINLQQYKNGSWATIKTWNESSSSRILSFSNTYSVSSGYEYRVSSTVTAYSGQNSETVTYISATKSY